MSILDQIIATKRKEIADRQQSKPIELLKVQASALPRPRNFFHAVTRPPQDGRPLNLIAEIKKASPSAGVIRADFDPVDTARQYAAAGADAVSVLTDQQYFQGHLDFLGQVRSAIPLPALRKDFIIDAYQVYESAAAGADAILLIAECLKTNELIDLQILATELHLTTLIEVHDIDNLMRVRDSVIGVPMRSYSLIGINNRDLRTFKTDLGTTLRMAELIEDRSVLVSESGIDSYRDVEKLAEVGVRAILVGEALMRADDIGATIRDLLFG